MKELDAELDHAMREAFEARYRHRDLSRLDHLPDCYASVFTRDLFRDFVSIFRAGAEFERKRAEEAKLQASLNPRPNLGS